MAEWKEATDCNPVNTGSNPVRALEGCLSGLKEPPAKRLMINFIRGFESRSFRMDNPCEDITINMANQFNENGRNRFPVSDPAICTCGHNANFHATDEFDTHCSQCACKAFENVIIDGKILH